MEPRRFVPDPIAVIVVLAGLLVAAYAIHVVRSVDDGGAAQSQPLPRPTASLSPSASPSDTATSEAPTPVKIEPFRRAAAKADTLLVVGDGSGDQAGEWVDLVAQDLAAGRQVTLHRWDNVGGAFIVSAVYGAGDPLDLWNLSYPGTTPAYAKRLDEVTATPGAVIVSVGHDRDAQAVTRTLRATTQAITAKWSDPPTALVLQNPSTGGAKKQQNQAIDAVNAAAVEDQLPVIDVRDAFLRAGDVGSLVAGDGLPNADGSRLWADITDRELGVPVRR